MTKNCSDGGLISVARARVSMQRCGKLNHHIPPHLVPFLSLPSLNHDIGIILQTTMTTLCLRDTTYLPYLQHDPNTQATTLALHDYESGVHSERVPMQSKQLIRIVLIGNLNL